MRKLLFPLLFCFMGFSLFAQVQRKTTGDNKVTTAAEEDQRKTSTELSNIGSKLKLVRELNLTADQKLRLKEIKQANKARKDEIMNNETLSENQKQERLKEIKISSASKFRGILTEEQRLKFKELRRAKRNNNI